ncbi:hypothetical protein K1T71_012679 [Dendrolimus kikuchii]|uniref:Uncharacterized protein n=1 Tax=Dendrolimus kikuchii TaxID=765133 RepID=A0ACC1CK05_9NEOP|nr:hypothetical protein K1T71_012679 [Dendrolimus kikuchii]
MFVKLLLCLILTLIPSGYCNDLYLGYPDATSRLIYSKVHQENPALWVRSQVFTVTCQGNQVINAIRILDLRQDKWGDAYITRGGIGQRFVTIELDSPSIFRGFNFLVDVYAIQTNYFMNSYGKK